MHAKDQDDLIQNMVADPNVQRTLKGILHQADKEGKLFRLLSDESALLIAYREWKASRSSDNGVFQWRIDASKR